VKPTFYCSLLHVMSINTCLMYGCLSSASAVKHSWFIYSNQRSWFVHSNQRFQGTHSTLSTPEISPVKSPYAFGFPIVNTPPPMPSEFHNQEPPLPLRNPKIGPWYGMDIFWNRPMSFSVYVYGHVG